MAGFGGEFIRWGAYVVDLENDEVLVDHHSDVVLATASVGKVLVLLTVADALQQGADPAELLDRRDVEPVADSGLWQHLAADQLSVLDAAVLVGSVSDNLATNVLLHRFGLAAVAEITERLEMETVRWYDIVRDGRDAAVHPPVLSTGNARELALLMGRIATRSCLSPDVCVAVESWLSASVDTSLVGAALALDPLSHAGVGAVRFLNKTGSDAGIRADAGVVRRDERSLAYACIANWGEAEERVGAVLAGHRMVGEVIRAALGDSWHDARHDP